jgi:hypothetical protein
MRFSNSFSSKNVVLSANEVKKFLFWQDTRLLERKAQTTWTLEFERRWSK